MSSNVNSPAPIKVVHCSPEVLIQSPTIDPQAIKTPIDLRSTAHRRPNPADGAPMPKNIRFFA